MYVLVPIFYQQFPCSGKEIPRKITCSCCVLKQRYLERFFSVLFLFFWGGAMGMGGGVWQRDYKIWQKVDCWGEKKKENQNTQKVVLKMCIAENMYIVQYHLIKKDIFLKLLCALAKRYSRRLFVVVFFWCRDIQEFKFVCLFWQRDTLKDYLLFLSLQATSARAGWDFVCTAIFLQIYDCTHIQSPPSFR